MSARTIRFATFEVDLDQRELRNGGKRVPLQQKPFRILELLLRHPGMLVTRKELAQELWPGLHVNFEHGLNTAVNTLRLVLGDSPRACRFIETRPGLGYRFIAPIREPKPGASQDYLTGRFFLNKMTGPALQRAIGCFQSALKEKPHCALALSGLADAYSQLALGGTVHPSDVRQTAREAAEAALRSGPDLAEAHIAAGRQRMIFDRDWAGADEALDDAVRLDPTLSDAYRARALMRASQNRPEEALRDIRRAHEIDPLSLPIGYELTWILCMFKRFDEAVAQAWIVLSLDPGFFPAQDVLGLAYGQLGTHDDALTECQNACVCSDRHPSALASLAYACGVAGRGSQAEQILAEMIDLSQQRYVSPYFMALVQVGLKQYDRALDSLEIASSTQDPLLLWLNADPRFAELNGLRVKGTHGFLQRPELDYQSSQF